MTKQQLVRIEHIRAMMTVDAGAAKRMASVLERSATSDKQAKQIRDAIAK